MSGRSPRSSEDDLVGLDLSRLDLDHIDLDDDLEAAPWWRPLAVLLLVGCGSALLWLPNTEFYQSQGHTNWIFFVICAGAALLGIVGGRWLWEWGEEAARSYARRHGPTAPYAPEPDAPPSATRRWLTFLAAAGGAIAIIAMAPDGGYLSGGGNGYTDSWFIAAAGAVAVGVLAGRFIMMHSNRPAEKRPPPEPIRLPPWFKWVTLAFLVGMGLFAMFGADLIPGADPEEVRFGLGGVGFVVGILAAIWLARRFEETEQRLREQTRRRV